MLLGGLVAILGSKEIDYAGAGALGCLIFAFVAAFGLRRQDLLDENVSIYYSCLKICPVFKLKCCDKF